MKRKSRMLCVSTKKFYVDNVNETQENCTHTRCMCMVESRSRVMCVLAFCCYFVWKMIKRCVSPAKVFGDVKCMSRIVRLLSDVVSRIHVYRVVFCLWCGCVCACVRMWMCAVSTVCGAVLCLRDKYRSQHIGPDTADVCIRLIFVSFFLSLLLLPLGFSSVSVAAAAVALLIAASVGRPFGRLSVFFSLSVFLLLHRRFLSQSNRSHLWWFAFVHVCVCAFCSALLCSQLMCAMCVFGSLAIMLTFIAIIVITIYLALCIVFVPKI